MTFGGGSGAGNESGAYSVYFTDMVIVGANGEVHPLYTGQPSASVNYVGAANMTGLAESIGQNITNGESHFYLSDDLNSVRMVLGGWPLSESTYTPFGQEVNATISGYNNTYKFTGMEQDAETDLDHTWFRQYAATQGRWMTPDPYNGSYDLTNPQSLNRYGYVNNGPTTGFDPSGLHEASCYNIIHCNPSLFWGGGVPNEGGGGGDGEFASIFSTFIQWGGGTSYNPDTNSFTTLSNGAFLPSTSFYSTMFSYSTTSASSPSNGLSTGNQVPVHGPWTYGNWCGAGGMGTPINGTDAGCQTHDNCYAQGGFSPGSNYQGSNAQLQGCNQKLCNTVRGRISALLQQAQGNAAAAGYSNSRGFSPAQFLTPGQYSELQADSDINFFFTWAILPGNSCHF